MDKATRGFSCKKCGRLWGEARNLPRHEKVCTGGKTQFYYPGGVYHPSYTPLETLVDNGIEINTAYVYEYRATYDFEAFMQPYTKETKRTKYVCRHVPMSVSICSNVPDYTEPQCFINDNGVQDLINQMGNYLELIATAAYERLREKFKDVFDQIAKKKNADELLAIFEKYLRQVPVVGYNSGKYDINLAKPYIIKRFLMKSDKPPQVIKKGNNFVSITTDQFIFLDMMNFLAPGFSYSNYLAAYKIKETKGFFPYEYLTDLSQLNETELPSREKFFSKLRNSHITEIDYAYCQKI